MNIQKLPAPAWLEEKFRQEGGKFPGLYRGNACLQVMVSEDPGGVGMHLSVSHPSRYPTWDEIRDLRYALLPNERTYALLFPPKEQYVNVHPNCFHLYEVPQMHEQQQQILTLEDWRRR